MCAKRIDLESSAFKRKMEARITWNKTQCRMNHDRVRSFIEYYYFYKAMIIIKYIMKIRSYRKFDRWLY